MNADDPIASMTPDDMINAILHSPDVVGQYGVVSHHVRGLITSVCPGPVAITDDSMLGDWASMARRALANQSVAGKGPADWAVLIYPVVMREFVGGPRRPYLYTITDTRAGRWIRAYEVGPQYDARFPDAVMSPDVACTVPTMLGGR